MAFNDTPRQWIAGRPFSATGRLNRVGGRLVLRGDELSFRPLLGLGIPLKFKLSDISHVTATQNKPAKLMIHLRNGRSVIFMVVPTRGTFVWSDDTSARDEAVSVISALLNPGWAR